MTDPDERYADLIRNEQATVIRELRVELAAARRTEAETKRDCAEEIRREVIKDYTEGSENVEPENLSAYDQGLADAENVIAAVRDRWHAATLCAECAVMPVDGHWHGAYHARAASLLAQPERLAAAGGFVPDSRIGQITDLTPTRDERPHSRACGFRWHEHGGECSVDCPTCNEDRRR